MALNYVTLVVDLVDGTGTVPSRGAALLAPSTVLADAADNLYIGQMQAWCQFTGAPAPTARLLATDNPGPLPAGWAWGISFTGLSPGPAGFSFFLPAGPVSFTATSASPCVFTFTPTAGLTAMPDSAAVQLSGGSLPAGFSSTATYYVVNSSGVTFQLAAAVNGSPLASASTGSGTATVTQCYLSSLSPVSSVVTMASYMPLPTGTPASGQVPIATGSGVTSAWGRNFAGLLTPTAVKTTTYSAAAGDYVPCDTTSGSFTVTLPSAPADLTVVGVKQVIQGGSNTVTVACAGSDVYNKTGGATSATLTLLAQGLLLQYKAAGGIWYVLADDLALSQLDARYLTLSGGTMTGSMGVPVKTVSTTNTTVAADWITLCNAASAGFTNNLPDATTVRAGASYIFKKTDATANEVQLLPVSAQTVDGATYLVLAAANAMADLRSDGSNWQAF